MARFSPNFAAKTTDIVFFGLLKVGDRKSQMKKDWVHRGKF
jgi:hypothetical protein